MNRNKIKFKHLMGLFKNLPGYPSDDDLIYEISSYLERDGRPNGEFSKKTYNSIWGSDWEKSIGNKISDLENSGIIEEVNKGGNKTWYKIKNNPYYD